MYAPERQQRIVAAAETQGRVEVSSLAASLNVTSETIRRDLASLESRGLVRRVHGGALPTRRQGFEPPLHRRVTTHVTEKDAIAGAALSLIDDSVRSILLDAGSTTTALARKIPTIVTDRELTVVTNSLPIAGLLADVAHVHLHLLGGRVRHRTMAAVGASVVTQLADLSVDVTFLGANGVHPDHGITTPDAQEAEAKRAMVRSADSVVALADASKLGQTHLCRIAHLAEIDTVITNADADDDLIHSLSAHGPEVLFA